MSEPFIGMIILVPYNFAPRGWAFCNGQILSIAQNTALFSLLGTTYGGNGQTTFALPDLRGRVAISGGQGPGLSNYTIGEQAGTETITLLTTQMPAHTHTIGLGTLAAAATARNTAANSRTPVGAMPAAEAAGVTATYSTDGAAPVASMAPGTVALSGAPTASMSGSSQPLSIVQPFLTLNYCIALEGIFPSRN
jgi:microcystin-dependent protein